MRYNFPIDNFFHLTNRPNRSNRQMFMGPFNDYYGDIFLSLANEMQLSNGQLHFFHSTNRSNRSNRQMFVGPYNDQYRDIFLSLANEI